MFTRRKGYHAIRCSHGRRRAGRTRPFFGALVLAVRERDSWRYIGHVGTGFSHKTLGELHGKLTPLKTAKSPFSFTEWTKAGEMRHPVYLGLRADKQAKDVVREQEKPRD